MASADLEYFQIDCRQKEAQIKFLQSQRTTRDDRLINGVENMINAFDQFIWPERSHQRREISSGRHNWLINQHLMRLKNDC